MKFSFKNLKLMKNCLDGFSILFFNIQEIQARCSSRNKFKSSARCFRVIERRAFQSVQLNEVIFGYINLLYGFIDKLVSQLAGLPVFVLLGFLSFPPLEPSEASKKSRDSSQQKHQEIHPSNFRNEQRYQKVDRQILRSLISGAAL